MTLSDLEDHYLNPTENMAHIGEYLIIDEQEIIRGLCYNFNCRNPLEGLLFKTINILLILIRVVNYTGCSVSGDTLRYRLKESVFHRRT